MQNRCLGYLVAFVVSIFAWTGQVAIAQPAASPSPRQLVTGARRILFLGDSITASGGYIVDFDAWLLTLKLKNPPTLIDGGLSSETVSGLSEEGHAGGKFPRPDLAERIDRLLPLVKADLVFACYGINCGIYQPFDESRLARYQQGLRSLREKVERSGAKLVLITPPTYDDSRKPGSFSYNKVLDRYAAWELSQRAQGWTVVDLHTPMTQALAARRRNDSTFTFQPDAVHPNAAGHWFIAQQLIGWCGDDRAASAETPEQLLEANQISPAVLKLLQQRLTVLRDAYVGAAGHKRPGVAQGLPIAEAQAKAAELTLTINELAGQRP